MNGGGAGNIQKLQVVDPTMLKTLMEQFNENLKRQRIINKLDASGINEIIHDYDRYMKEPGNSASKDLLNDNLLSRVEKYKRNTKSGDNLKDLVSKIKEDSEECTKTDIALKKHAKSVQNFVKKGLENQMMGL